MVETTALFRPVGLFELALIWDKGMREFPPRLPQQPFFYPVANIRYARQIARDWNTRDESSGFSGFVTRFQVANSYLSNFEQRTVGSSEHVEYWIPAEELASFNRAIQGLVEIEEAFFGATFAGFVPDAYGLKGKEAAVFALVRSSPKIVRRCARSPSCGTLLSNPLSVECLATRLRN
jgi:hypothetical protein